MFTGRSPSASPPGPFNGHAREAISRTYVDEPPPSPSLIPNIPSQALNPVAKSRLCLLIRWQTSNTTGTLFIVEINLLFYFLIDVVRKTP
ncbi:hypothetical protein Y032_0296g1679 [Ancylostoma ceylanicum]|uniref:Uncharacterized protein n=1 Tax=Ancylostoma ceylanicum TaxID=53326 RepID=A0A016S4D5_9BILA|nr:hypothetical protein Y032_0296g1679 [Ancylostoma ceylanicum]